MKIFDVNSRSIDVAEARNSNDIMTSDMAFVWAGDHLSREEMALMLSCHTIPMVVASPSPFEIDESTTTAKYLSNSHFLGSCHSREAALGLAQKCVEHACGSMLSIAFSGTLAILEKSGSPIEERLAIHLADSLCCVADIEPQFPLRIDGKNYRADFMISNPDSQLKMIVEADGHDFHEKTKEQAAKDKSRDRAMLAAGYRVMRFTGSEIWHDPHKCAQEVKSFFEENQ